MNFKKMHGLGNDFVILDQRAGREVLDEDFIRKVCDRSRGIGCDQFIVMEPSAKANVFMRIYNPDASESGACGNATRCVADIVMKDNGSETCTIETLRGALPCRKYNDLIEVDMGPPVEWHDMEDINDPVMGKPVFVDMGNPHCVFFVDNAEKADIGLAGPQYEYHPAFPNRANIEFVHIINKSTIRARVWERGAGVTQACGSGACAIIAAAFHRGLVDTMVDVELDGGTLHMEIREEDDHVLMTGPVAYVFDGELFDL